MGEIPYMHALKDNLKMLLPFAVGALAASIPAAIYVHWNQHRQTMLTGTVLNLLQELTWWRGGGGPDGDGMGCPIHGPGGDGDDDDCDSNRG